MVHDQAARHNAEHPFYDLFHAMEPVVANTIPEEGFVSAEALLQTYKNLQASFEKDMHRLADVSELLLGNDIAAYGERCTAVFDRWENEGGGPALTAMIAHAIQNFNLDPASPVVKAAFIAAILAEIPNDLKYHGNEHYRKVVFHAIRLIATHNGYDVSSDHLNEDEVALLLAAACIHDLGHPGGDNAKEGVYAPGLMEQKSFDAARPYFDAVELSTDMRGQIETIVFCTDITFFAGDYSPCVRMKKIYKHFFWDDDSEDVSMMMMGKLRRFEDNKNLILIAMFLHEADIGTSAGLSYERTISETVSFLEERNISVAGPKTVLAFLRDQLGETMFTDAGKQLFGPVMSRVIAQAEQDILSGVESFR